MRKFFDKHRVIILNLLIAIAISLVVNFSYLILIVSGSQVQSRFQAPHQPETSSAQSNLKPNNQDNRNKERRSDTINMQDVTTPVVNLQTQPGQGQNNKWAWVMREPMWVQLLWFILIAFVLNMIVTSESYRYKKGVNSYLRKVILAIVMMVLFYLLTPVVNRQGEWNIIAFSNRHLNPMLMLKSSFTLIVALLYGKIYELLFQKQSIELENEMLKNENLQSTYNMLMNQINPHFFFNSLNSLAMLVREKHNDDALTYIDRLSDTFRYIIQNGQNGLIPLRDELEFLDAYKYSLEVRYYNKLFFNINVDANHENWSLPSLALLPLIENAVKHNTITTAHPLNITICVNRDNLIVSNLITPKIEDTKGTGIGLKNLSSRYILLTGQDITVDNDGKIFSVTLPLIAPQI